MAAPAAAPPLCHKGDFHPTAGRPAARTCGVVAAARAERRWTHNFDFDLSSFFWRIDIKCILENCLYLFGEYDLGVDFCEIGNRQFDPIFVCLKQGRAEADD